MKRKAVSIGIAVLFCLGVVVTRAFWDGRRALADGDAAHARGDDREAIVKWRRAARWYVPGAPHVRSAYGRLEALAEAARGRGDAALELEAWRAIRSSILTTHSFYTPFPAKLDRANQRIAELMARAEPPAIDPGADEAARAAWHLSLLRRDEAPSVGWSFLALLGFAAWVGGGFWFAWRGVTPDDRLDRRQAALSGCLVLAGLLLWMVSLYRA